LSLLLISGSLRAGSTNTALLKTVHSLSPRQSVLYEGLSGLPHYNPDDDHDPLPPAVAELRELVGRADALLFCTPEYAGGLPGTFKNLLDWTVGGGEMHGKSVAWVNVSGPAAPHGGDDAHASLRKVLGYTGSVIAEAACLRIPLVRQQFGPDGLISDPMVRVQLQHLLNVISGPKILPVA
jgi:chromate reductase, NAD(P)H dehydrogenase (quinone)